MIFIIVPKLLRKRFNGMALWPFVLLREEGLKNDTRFLNHERIHFRQQKELLVIFFYGWYGLEYLVRLIQYRNRFTAYRNISFEREAYSNEKDLHYLQGRALWSFLRYI